MIIRNRSSHIPTLTDTVVQNIHLALRRTFLKSHKGTGMRYAVMMKIMNRSMYGHVNIWSSLSASSGPSSVNIAKKNSSAKKKNHVVAPIMSRRPMASK